MSAWRLRRLRDASQVQLHHHARGGVRGGLTCVGSLERIRAAICALSGSLVEGRAASVASEVSESCMDTSGTEEATEAWDGTCIMETGLCCCWGSASDVDRWGAASVIGRSCRQRAMGQHAPSCIV